MDPVLTTDRLTLRMPERRDAPAYAEILGHADVATQTASFFIGYDIRSAEGRIDISRARWAVGSAYDWFVEFDGQMIGSLSLFQTAQGWEVGYAIHPDKWGQGFGREALEAILDMHHRANPNTPLLALIQTDNPRSRKLAEGLGFSAYPGLTDSYSLACDRYMPCWTLVHPGGQQNLEPNQVRVAHHKETAA